MVYDCFGMPITASVFNALLSLFGRKKAHTRERNLMPSVTFLATKLVDRYHQNSTVTMHMYVPDF